MTRVLSVVAVTLALLAGFSAADVRGVDAANPSTAMAQVSPDFHGVGPLRFGMTVAQMRKAWRMPLRGGPLPGDPTGGACYYLMPRGGSNDLMLMVEEGRFVRVDVATSAAAAPGGGRVGMSLDAVRKLYAGRVKAAPSSYDAAAMDLRVTPSHGEKTLLLFEVNAAGKVTSWRVGETHQVNYVEGCS